MPAHSVEASSITIRSWRWQEDFSPPACPGKLRQVNVSNGKAKTNKRSSILIYNSFEIRTFPKTVWKQDIETSQNQNVKGHTSVLSVKRVPKSHFTQRSLGHPASNSSQTVPWSLKTQGPAFWFRSHYGHVGCGAVATFRQRDGSPSHHASSGSSNFTGRNFEVLNFKFGFKLLQETCSESPLPDRKQT